MTLKETLQKDLQDALRARDERRKAVVRMVLSAIQFAEVETGNDLDDAAAQEQIRKEIRRREDALTLMRDAGRADVVAEETAQLELLRAYLPQMLAPAELQVLAREAIAEAGATTPADLGKVMQILMPRVKGKADGRTVNQIARDLLTA